MEHKDIDALKTKKLWSGTLVLTGDKEAQADVIIINKDGGGISLNSLMKGTKDLSKDAMKEKMKAYKLAPFRVVIFNDILSYQR